MRVRVARASATAALLSGRVRGGKRPQEADPGALDLATPAALPPAIALDRAKPRDGNGNWAVFTVTDGNLLTGQNPGSSTQLAEDVTAALA